MPKAKIVPIHITEPDGSVKVISKRQTSLVDFLNKVAEVPPLVDQGVNNILTLGFFKGIEFKMYPFEGRYWGLRITLEEIYPAIRESFNKLCNEYVEDFDCYWLEKEIDYKRIDRSVFYKKIGVRKSDAKKTGGDLILLSVEGIIKLVSRSSKIRSVLFWLIKKFTEYKLLKFEVDNLWRKLQKTESPPETLYYLAAMRVIDIERMVPQKKIGKFRGDFVIANKFLVMIKGWRWHSKKSQIYNDAKRERYIQKEGFYCIIFWAYEVLENPEKCVLETIETINKHKELLEDKK